MISIVQENGYYHVVVFNEFTLHDFQEFEQSVKYASQFEGPVRLLVDLRDMAGYTIDMAVEEIRFSKEHGQDIDKIAIITDDQWVTWSAWLTRIITDAEIKVFKEPSEGLLWIMQSSPIQPDAG